MTNAELNRDIKRLKNAITSKLKEATKTGDNTPYYDYIANEARAEFLRLYRADHDFTAMNRSSILIMLRLNISHRFEPLHMFGIYIELGKL